MSLFGMLISAPIKVAAATVRVAGMVGDVATGQPVSGGHNFLDDVAEVVEKDVNKILGKK